MKVPSISLNRFSSDKATKISRCILIALIIIAAVLLFPKLHFISPTDSAGYHANLLEKMQSAKTFNDFTNALFCYEASSDSISTAYLLKKPSDYDIPALEPRLTSFSYKKYSQASTKQTNQKTLDLISDCLNNFSDPTLDEADQLTYDLLQNHLELSKSLADYSFYEELLGGSTGVQANLPVTLGEYPLRNEDDIQCYLNLLKQVPDYFKDVIAYEKKRNSDLTKTPDFVLLSAKENLEAMLKGFQNGDNSFVDTFNERVTKLNNISKSKCKQFQKQNENYVQKYIIPAYEDLYAYLEDVLPEDTTKTTSLIDPDTAYGLAALPNGAEYYSLLVKDATGSSRSVPDLISMTDAAYKEAVGNVLNIALTDQKAYLYYCEHPMETYYQSPDAILQALSLMIRKDYPLLKDTPSYQIKTVSDSLAASLSPAFYMIPAIDDYQDNTIYINPLYTNEQNGNLFTTLAHEGFPGHLYQTVYFNETNPSCIRQVLNYPGYVEGWATYAEMNSYNFLEYPMEGNSLCRLYQTENIINLALSSRIDLGVNYEGWTLEDTKKFFEDNGFNSYYAADVYSYVVEAPANYLSYFIGYLEIMDLKKAYKNQEMENYSEQEFHKRLLDIGPADFETVRKYMLVNP